MPPLLSASEADVVRTLTKKGLPIDVIAVSLKCTEAAVAAVIANDSAPVAPLGAREADAARSLAERGIPHAVIAQSLKCSEAAVAAAVAPEAADGEEEQALERAIALSKQEPARPEPAPKATAEPEAPAEPKATDSESLVAGVSVWSLGA